MRTALRSRGVALMALLAISLLVLACAWVPRHSQARSVGTTTGLGALAATAQGGGFGGGGGLMPGGADAEPPPVERVHVARPVSAKAAMAWVKLNESIPMEFANETALEDVIKYIKENTHCEEMPNGLSFYVEPLALQNVEKTMSSPVTIDLKDVPLATTLTLALSQLGLAYSVTNDGLIIIDSKDDPACPLTDETPRVLDELVALRREVADLRAAVNTLTGNHPMGGMMGGMGGMGGGMMGGPPPQEPATKK